MSRHHQGPSLRSALLTSVWLLPLASEATDTGYQRFYSAFAKNDRPTLTALAHDPSRVTTGQWVPILARAVILFRDDRLKDCMLVLDTMELALSKSQEANGRGWLHKMRSMTLSAVGRHTVALSSINASLVEHERSLFPREHVDQLVLRAEIHRALDDHAAALTDLNQASRMADSLGYIRGKCMIALNLGNIDYEQGQYVRARTHFEECHRMASIEGFELLANNALNNIGSSAVMSGDQRHAIELYHRALRSIGASQPRQRISIYDQLATAHRELGELTTAHDFHQRALALNDSIDDHHMRPVLLQHFSACLWEMGRRDTAEKVLHTVLASTQEQGRSQLALEVRAWLAYYTYMGGDYRAAYAHKEAEMALNDSLLKSRFGENVGVHEVLYETERKERRIAEQDQALVLAAVEDRRKSTQRNAFIGATLLLALLAFLLYRAMRNRQRLAKKEKELHDEQVDQLLSQQEIKSINAMLEGQEKERDRVAKDLHDRLGSMLGGIKVNMEALEDRVEQMRQEQQYHKVNRLLDQAVGELRQISHDMAAATLSRFGLEKALQDLRDTLHISGRLNVELKTFGLDHRLERSVELAVYRMVQELVSNVLKHANARELSISVTRSPGRLSVVVADDGKGFDANVHAEGMGLDNVRSRASALGASVQVDSTPGKGTTVSVECPVVE